MAKHNYGVLKQLPLFAGIEDQGDLDWLLNCIDGKEKWYEPGDVIQAPGESVEFTGVILSGTAQVYRQEATGEETQVETLESGALYSLYPPAGKSAADEVPSESPVGIKAVTECQVLPLRWKRLMHLCNFNCEYHQRLIDNMNEILKQK